MTNSETSTIERFLLTRPVYTPREVASIYSHYVHRVTYATILQWIRVHGATGGREGIAANTAASPRSGRYYITQAELRRVLLLGGATEEETQTQ